MPQMAPINWTIMMAYFTLILITFNILNYYNFFYSMKIYKFKKTNLKLNWKW